MTDYGEGIPVAWAISNREDTTLLVEYLKAVYASVGELKPEYFMSDCAEQYFHAWSGVFTKGNTKKLLCIWHVDRAWRKALNDHVSEKASRIEIYHQLRVLLNEREESQFIVRLQQFMSFLHDTYEDFYKYFNTHYIPITCQWATCYRVNTVVNTNMYTESFHRSLKVVYLNNKQNRRVDTLLYVLLRIARNLIYEQLKKVEIGKNTHKITEIHKRHKIASDLLEQSAIHQIKEGVFQIQSLSKKNTVYTMEKRKDQCCCKLRCSTCDICIHMYSCTCMDATLHSTICKHVHLLKTSLTTGKICVANSVEVEGVSDNEDGTEEYDIGTDCETTTTDDDDDEQTIEVEETIEVEDDPGPTLELPTHEYFFHMLQNDDTTGVIQKKAQVEDLAHNLLSLVKPCNDIDVLQTVYEHLKSAVFVMKAKNQQGSNPSNFTQKITPAPNQNHEKQLRFYSTAKTKKKNNKRWAKPTDKEEKKAIAKLKKTSVKVCCVCWKEEDYNHDSNVDITWVECDSCKAWLHLSCTSTSDLTNDDEYYCKNCQ